MNYFFLSFSALFAIVPFFLYFILGSNLIGSGELLRSFIETSFIEQLLVVLSAFVIKPIYMGLSLINYYLLKDATSPDITSLRKAMLFFFVGESFCAINFIFFNEQSLFVDYLHTLGMIGCFGYTCYGLLEFIDIRLIKFGIKEEKCALIKSCGKCYKYSEVNCNIKKIIQFSIPIIAICACLPLVSNIRVVSYKSSIFGSPYVFEHPIAAQWFEAIYCPLAAILLFMVVFITIQLEYQNSIMHSKILMSMGFAFLGFGLFRVIPLNLYYNKMGYFTAWEEFTELFFVLIVFYIIWLYKRHIHTNPIIKLFSSR